MIYLQEFPYPDDTCYISHCFPYSYSELCIDIDRILSDPRRNKHIQKEVLCETLAGNACFLLTVTNHLDKNQQFQQTKNGEVGVRAKTQIFSRPNVSSPNVQCVRVQSPAKSISAREKGNEENSDHSEQNINPKKIILITARVHPGEPNSSWMMKGFIDFITSDNSIALVEFLFTFIFIIYYTY